MNAQPQARNYEVVVMGGGLAGLTLALQLKRRFADIGILVLERRAHPVPLAAHKVGESTVEIGAHYFENVLGLKAHLEQEQLKKFGFRFFFSDGRMDLDQVTELGASQVLPTQSYQIDRGIFENRLGQLAREAGIDFIDQCTVRRFDIAEDGPHTVEYQAGSETVQVQARWLIDASGRAGLIKRKLDLAEPNGHQAGAVWFRINARIDVNDWSDDEKWLGRCIPRDRWRSTNHLVGEGYWVWLIPLASGSHSVGIVADGEMHPIEDMNTFDTAMDWLQRYQPRLHAHLQPVRDKLQDFAFFKRFSYGCKQVFSGKQRWALTGEAGVFLDPYYSPGSDFIAISNTYITALIGHDRAQAPVARYAEFYQQMYLSMYQAMLSLYEGQYGLFGDPEVLPHKVAWDYTYYWGVMCPLFFQDKLTDLPLMARLSPVMMKSQDLNCAMQAFLRAWSEVSSKRNPPQMLDQTGLPWFYELNRGLQDALDSAGLTQRMNDNLALLQRLARQLLHRAGTSYPALLDTEAVRKVAALAGDWMPGEKKEDMLFSDAAYGAMNHPATGGPAAQQPAAKISVANA